MRRCFLCQKKLANGGAEVSHLRVHVRRGELEEYKDAVGKISFRKRRQELESTAQESPFAMLGDDPRDGQPKKVWEVPIDELKAIDPKQYFVTTGEAIAKTEQLIADIKQLLIDTKRFMSKFKKVKDDSKYLETAWESRRLVVKRKDPRRKELR